MHHGHYTKVRYVLGLAGLALLGLQGCATGSGTGSQAGEEATVDFPAIDEAWMDEGAYVNHDDLRQMRAGISKDQIYALLGRPHFQEGLFNVREWNYIFHLPVEPDSDSTQYMTCQYQVRFDDDMLAESLHWRDPQCATAMEPQTVSAEPTRLQLSADALFDFDSALLTPAGKAEMVSLAERIQTDFTSPSIDVVGHTDRLGGTAYNQALSEQRAAAVRRALIDEGVAPNAIHSRGRGAREPVTRCAGDRQTSALTSCLQPNRRVEVDVAER